jgi:TonB family protein
VASSPSALRPRAFESPLDLLGSVGGSVFLHLAVLLSLVFAEWCRGPEAPLVDPRNVMTVQAVSLPKQTTALPQRAERTPDPVAGAPTKTETPPPPPTASDMVVHKPDAPKPQGEVVDRSKERQAALDQARKAALLKDLSAPIGSEDRQATDPDGSDAPTLYGGSGQGITDKELAAWVNACRAAIIPNWTPLPSTLAANPGYVVILEVKVEADGSIDTPRVLKGTGDSSFDQSARNAVLKTGRLPPPPAKWRNSVAQGTQITLMASDKR